MENKTTLTFSYAGDGDENFYLTLSSRLAEMLSDYTVEWKHTYGRSTHQLKLRSKVLPLNQVLLDRKDLITKPYFHVFWVDCTDTNQYTYCVRGKIMLWLDQLSKCGNVEWMLIVLVNDVLTRITKAKLPLKKSAIVDKIKSEFCHKNSDRIQILHEATKETTKSTESWQTLVAKVALTTTRSMENQVSAYEEKVRSERERRNEKSWDFCTYFLMQEELAFMYEMLGMFNSALVQYDELDAMFTQYIVNAKSGDIAHWLSRFSERPITDWNALLLWKPIDTEARRRIIAGSASLVDVRNYLFGRLCHLLIKMGQPHKVASRMYYFLHSISNEMKILEISVTEGAVDCWVFMCSLELVIALQRQANLTNNSGHHSNGEAAAASVNSRDGSTSNSASLDAKHKMLLLENAVLWNMARDKLFALGKLCGLLPGPKTSSAQLEKVVGLLSGMGLDEERNDDIKSPHSVLREALSSKSNFRRHYFELAELAMGTFKHMGRYRAARNIGAQLAEFYMLAGEPEQGESYLLEWSRMFAKDGWSRLQSHANEKLAACYKQSGNSRKYIRLCYELVCDTSRSTPCEKQQHYCDQLISFARNQLEEDYAVNLYPMATLTTVRFLPARVQFQRNSLQEVRLELALLHSSPKEMRFDRMELGVNKTPPPTTDNHRGRRQHRRGHSRNISNTSSVFKMAVDSDEDEEDEINLNQASVNSLIPYENRQHNLARVRGQLSSSCSVKELPLDTFEMGEDGSIRVINLHQSSKRHENGVNGNFEEKVHNKVDGEVNRTSLSCRHAKTILRRQDSTHSQFGKHAIHNKSITLEKCDDLIVLENIHLQRGSNQLSFKLNTQQSESFRISQIRLVIGKLFFVLPSVYPTIIYTISDKKPIFDVDTSHFNGGKLYSGLPFSIKMSVDLGDRHLNNNDDEDCCLTIKAAMWLRVLCVHNCTITTSEGLELEVDEDPVVESGTTTTRIRLPRAQPGSKVMMTAECVRDITDYHPTPSSSTTSGGNQLHIINTHRRTHSAPISTMKMTSSAASLRHHHSMMMSDEDSEVATNNSIASEFVELTIEDRDLSPPPSDTGSDVAVEEHEMSEVALNDDGLGDGEADQTAMLVKPSMPTIVVDKMMEFLTPKKSTNVTTSQHSSKSNNVRSASAERISNEKRTRSPLAGSRDQQQPQHRRISRSVASPPDSLRFNIPQVNVEKSQHPTSPVNCSDIEATFTSPWSDVGAVTSLFSFHRPLAFAHAWSFSTKCKRYLSVSVENLTTDRILHLSNSSLKFTTDDKVTMTALNPPNISCELRPDHSCTFAWQVSSVPSRDVISAMFDVDVTTTNQHVSTGHVTKGATYLFEVENVKTIYSVTCHQTNSDELLRCGVMTSLTITVTRDRNDDGHTTTSAGQQLLMFQVIDKRGGWAVCGKSSGILTFPAPITNEAEDGEEEENRVFDTMIKIDVMPLQTGYLHFPYVLLNRYVKRTSEFDEKLSSTDSPVLRPPKLKSFNHGDVFYIDQARRVRVVAPEWQPDQHTATTTL